METVAVKVFPEKREKRDSSVIRGRLERMGNPVKRVNQGLMGWLVQMD